MASLFSQAKNALGTIGIFGTRSQGSIPDTDPRKYIFREQLQRVAQDVSTWRNSVKKAEDVLMPQRTDMMQLYQDTVLNGHVNACLTRRSDMTLLKKRGFYKPNGEMDEVTTERLNKQWLSLFLKYALDAKYYGYSLITWSGIENDRLTDVALLRREYVEPESKGITPLMWTPVVQPIAGSKFEDWVMLIDTPSETGSTRCGFGLLYTVAYYEIFLRHLTGFNADFVELFGQPIRIGSTTKTGDALDEFESALANMGSSAYMVTTDMSDKIELKSATGQGEGYKSYDNFEQRLEKKISKVLLGHSDAMDSTSGKLGSQQGKDNPVYESLQDVCKKDCDFLTEVINDNLIPRLRKLGYNIPAGVRFQFANDLEKREEKKQETEMRSGVAEYVSKLHAAGFTMDAAELSEILGVDVYPAQEQAASPNDTEGDQNDF
jgi:phage gp29-like protein